MVAKTWGQGKLQNKAKKGITVILLRIVLTLERQENGCFLKDSLLFYRINSRLAWAI